MDYALQLIKSDVSPAIYRLLSSITVSKLGGAQDLGVPDIPDRETYIADLVEVWTGCGAVLVENNQRVRLSRLQFSQAQTDQNTPVGLVILHERVRQGILAENQRCRGAIRGRYALCCWHVRA